MKSYRIFVEKYPEFRVEAESLQHDLNENLGLHLSQLRLLNVYDLFGFSAEERRQAELGISKKRNSRRGAKRKRPGNPHYSPRPPLRRNRRAKCRKRRHRSVIPKTCMPP